MMIQREKLLKGLSVIKKYTGLLFDAVYISLFTVLLVYSFLNNTQFQIPWMEWLQKDDFRSFLIEHVLFHPEQLLLVVLICRYLFSCTYQIKEYLITAFICFCLFYAYSKSGGDIEAALIFLLLLLGARGLQFRKLIGWGTVCMEIMFAVTVIASQTGYVENLVYRMNGRNVRVAFGFFYPTIFAAQLFFLILNIWYLIGERWNLFLSMISLMAAVFVYVGSEARFTTACFILLSVILGVRGWKIWSAGKRGQCYQMGDRLARVLAVFPILCAFGIHIISIGYRSSVGWMKACNQLVSNRLSLAKKAIQVYGFRLWGNSIPMVGYGGSTERQERYFYLDSSYMQLSLIAGMVIFGIVLCLLMAAGYRAKAKKEWTLLWILAFAGMHAVFEEHLLNLSICLYLFAAVSELGRKCRK